MSLVPSPIISFLTHTSQKHNAIAGVVRLPKHIFEAENGLTARMFAKLGLFRFVKDYDRPLASLEVALKHHGDVDGSLIVLPEGFNIGGDYLHTEIGMRDPGILHSLQDIAESFGSTFVAGLIVDQPDAPKAPAKPFSSSYLIDGGGSTLLCRKMGDDTSRNYTTCRANYDVHNPLRYGDVAITSLLCMDSAADDPVIRERERRLIRVLAAEPCPWKIVCVPANMGNHYRAKEIARAWLGAYFILANSRRWGCRSLITNGEITVFEDNPGDENALFMYSPSGGPPIPA